MAKIAKNTWVNKLAIARLSVNPLRTVITILSSAIMIALFATFFNIAVGVLKTSEQVMHDAAGTMAVYQLKNPTERQIRTLRESGRFDGVGLEINVGEAKFGQTEITLLRIDDVEWNDNRKPTVGDINGAMPSEWPDIMVSTQTLQKLGILMPSIGQELSAIIRSEDMSGNNEITFRLSGWFRDLSEWNADARLIGYVSSTFADENQPYATVKQKENQLDATIKQKENQPDETVKQKKNQLEATVEQNENQPEATVEQNENQPEATVKQKENEVRTVFFRTKHYPVLSDILKIVTLSYSADKAVQKEQQLIASISKGLDLSDNQIIERIYTEPDNTFKIWEVAFVFFAIALCVALCAVLLLYDCFYLAAENETKQSMLLRSIGMTYRQMRKVSIRYVLWISAVSGLIGGILSLAFSVMIVPLYVQTSVPMGMRVSYYWSIITLLLAIGITLLIMIAGARYAEEAVHAIIKKEKPDEEESDEECLEKERPGVERPGVGRAGEERHGMARTGEERHGVGQAGEERHGVGQAGEERHGVGRTGEERHRVGQPGMERPSVEQLDVKRPIEEWSEEGQHKEGRSKDKWCNYIFILAAGNAFRTIKKNKHVFLSLITAAVAFITVSLIVNGIEPEEYADWQLSGHDFRLNNTTPSYGETLIFDEDYLERIEAYGKEVFSASFIEELKNREGVKMVTIEKEEIIPIPVINFENKGPIISTITIDVTDEQIIPIDVWLHRQVAAEKYISLDSRIQTLHYMKASKTAAYVIGYTLVLLICLIAILSLLNMTSLNAAERKKEFVILWGVGMTQRQIRRMLTIEGFLYATLLAVSTVIICNIVVFQIFLAYVFTYQSFNYPYGNVIGVCVCIYLIAIILPIIVHRRLLNIKPL